MNALHALTKEKNDEITKAIAEAEKSTSAEIVCAVATESGRYDRAESIVGLVFGLVGLCLTHVQATGFTLQPGEWASTEGLRMGWQCAVVVAGFIFGSLFASYAHPVRRFFTRDEEMESETWRAASHVFTRSSAEGIASRAGVVVYLSLFERRVIVLAGKAATESLGEEGLRRIRDAALAPLKKGKIADALVAAVAEVAQLAAYALPPRENNLDELPNRVLVFHPRP
jgi:putative membrane protein